MNREDLSHEITLKWKMRREGWDHWVRGLGRRTVEDVITDGLRDIQEKTGRREVIAQRAKEIGTNRGREQARIAEEPPRHEISVTVASQRWQVAMSEVDAGEQYLRSGELLAAIIFSDDSWRERRDAEHSAGSENEYKGLGEAVTRGMSASDHEDDVVESLLSVSTRRVPTEISLKKREIRLLTWAVVGAVTSGIGTGILAAIGVWKTLCP